MIALYPFQAEAVAAVLAAIAAGDRRLLLTWATGLGKTVAFSHVVDRRPGRALVLAHRDELIAQAVAKLRLVMPEAAIGVVQADRDEVAAPIVVASVQTVSRRRRLATLGTDFATVVIDEAHHVEATSYQRVLDHVGAFASDGPVVLGVTATPYRLDGKPLGHTFGRIVHRMSILDGILGGYLCDLEARRLQVDVDLSAIPTRRGDLDEGATEKALLAARSETVIAAALAQYGRDRRRILVFTPGVDLAHAVAAAAQAEGLVAEAIDGAMPLDARRGILARFASGKTQVVANCAVLTEGFDEPGVDCVVVARPTRSRGLYTQMVGRGTRRHFAKPTCLVLDLVGVGHRFDLVTMPDLVMGELVARVGHVGALDVRGALRNGAALGHAVGDAYAAQSIEFRETVVNLFAAGKLLWVERAGGFAIDVGADRVAVDRVVGGAEWRVLHSRGGTTTEVWRGASVEYARGVAERFVADLDPPRFVYRGRWCDEPPTEKQRLVLERHGLFTPGMTRGQASERIGALVRTWDRTA